MIIKILLNISFLLYTQENIIKFILFFNPKMYCFLHTKKHSHFYPPHEPQHPQKSNPNYSQSCQKPRTSIHHAYVRSHTQSSCGSYMLAIGSWRYLGAARRRPSLQQQALAYNPKHHTRHHTSSAHLRVLRALFVPSLRTSSHHTSTASEPKSNPNYSESCQKPRTLSY